MTGRLREDPRRRRGTPARSIPFRPSPTGCSPVRALQKRRRVARQGAVQTRQVFKPGGRLRGRRLFAEAAAICCRACGSRNLGRPIRPTPIPPRGCRAASGSTGLPARSTVAAGCSRLPRDLRLMSRRAPWSSARRLGPLQIRDHAAGDDQFRQSRDGQMSDHHGRNRDAQRIRRIQGRAGSIVKQQRLNPNSIAASSADS